MKSVLGELNTSALADLLVIPYAGPVATVEEALIQHRGPIAATMIGGRWEWIAPGWGSLGSVSGADRLSTPSP